MTVKLGATTLGSGTLSAGKATVALPASLAVGAHSLTVTYSGDGTYGAATDTAAATVTKVASTTTATAPKKVKAKRSSPSPRRSPRWGGAPTGTVQVYDGTKPIGTGTLANGKVTITITKGLKKRGSHTLTVKYLGSATVAASQTTVKVRVTKKKKHHHR